LSGRRAEQQEAEERLEPEVGLPRGLDAVLFDMDGVVTDTAQAHAAAWTRLFDEYLKKRAAERGEEFRPFEPERDYRGLVDGKPRYDGVRDFLASRGIELPDGSEDDDPDQETVRGLGNRKNRYLHAWLEGNRVKIFPGTLAFVDALKRAGIRTAVFSSSRNAAAVLRNAGVLDLFDAKVDGNDMAELSLPGKPDPAILHEAASRVGVAPQRAAVVEDALAGVEAGARGGFALVIGVNRGDYGQALRAHGAELVVHDMSELTFDADRRVEPKTVARVPLVWDRQQDLRERLARKSPVVFLDYDGRLTPIVDDYNQAILADEMRAVVAELARHYTVGIFSGRDLKDLRKLVRLDSLFYAGSHGFDIAGPTGWRETLQEGTEFLPELDRAERELRKRLAAIEGHAVERKMFAIAVHYRRVKADRVGEVEQVVEQVLAQQPRLRKGSGKKVLRVQPRTDWDKGHAVLWLLEHLGLDRPDHLPIYVGDDVTDEDAFRALHDRGLGIVIRDGESRSTAAGYALDGPEDVQRFLGWLIDHSRKRPT
jgi:trehalose 6-phosphate phosphatase